MNVKLMSKIEKNYPHFGIFLYLIVSFCLYWKKVKTLKYYCSRYKVLQKITLQIGTFLGKQKIYEPLHNASVHEIANIVASKLI